jgi:hypothetical protein
VSALGRQAARLATAAAIAWALLGAESVIRPGQHNERDVVWVVPWLLTAAAFAGLHERQRRADRRGERWSFRLVLGAMAAVLLGQVGVVLDIAVLKVLGFPLGALLWLVAMIPFGVATVRARVVPRRVGIALALLEPGSILTGLALAPVAGLAERGGYSGALGKGLVLALLAAGLLEERRAAAASREPEREAVH